MQPCGTPAVLQYTTAASAGAAVSETAATVEKAVKATAALSHFDLFNMTSLLFQAVLRWTDRSPQPTRRYMGHGRALQHPMKMGVWRKRAARAFSSEVETGSRQENASIKKLQARFRLKTRRLK